MKLEVSENSNQADQDPKDFDQERRKVETANHKGNDYEAGADCIKQRVG